MEPIEALCVPSKQVVAGSSPAAPTNSFVAFSDFVRCCFITAIAKASHYWLDRIWLALHSR